MFRHVISLGPRNIYKIFAGGNHSWVVLDDIIPVRMKYRAPSPIPERQPSNSASPNSRNQRSNSANRQSTKITKANLTGKQLVFDNEPHFEIEISYSQDSAMIHRFINFEISPDSHDKVAEALQKYISLVE